MSENMVQDILSTARSYFPLSNPVAPELLEDLIREAIRASDEAYGIAAAVQWADGFEFSADMIASDVRCFEAALLDFRAMVRRRIKSLSPERLNSERANGLRRDNPDKHLLIELAEKGMVVPRPANFTPNVDPTGASPTDPLRKSYLRVHQAVNKMLADTVRQRLAFILPKAMALRYIDNLHFAVAHWTPKKGKPSGRPIGDLTYVQGTPLNSPEATAAAEEHYGPILHPTIDSIAQMITSFWDSALAKNPLARWEDLRIWKMDLKGAYTLLSYNPEDVSLFAMELTGDLVYLQFAGIFGWSCTPAAFQAVTRALQHELRHVLSSSLLMYVDDIIGVCFEADLKEDLAKAAKVCTDLLGPSAVAQDKTESGVRLDVLGYVIDLHLRRVSIARKNHLNTLYSFLSVNLDGKISLKVAERLASYSSRYGRICRVMRPFSRALHNLTAHRKKYALIDITTEARIAIRLWRAMLYLTHFDELRFTRSLDSFRETLPAYIVECDASLTGVGVLIYERIHGTEVCLGGGAIDIRGLGFKGESANQNLAEYIGAITGLLALIVLGARCRDVEVRGDSVAALTWVQTERARGPRVSNASMIFTAMCLMYDMDVKVATHISGDDNFRCDKLSRLSESGKSTRQTMDELGLRESRIIELQERGSIRRLVQLCDPELQFVDEGKFISHWDEVRGALEELKGDHTTSL